jgi:hypothetical protein
MTTFERRRAVCVVCLTDHSLRQDGTVGQHKQDAGPCAGVGQRPMKGTVRVVGVTARMSSPRGKCPECQGEWRVRSNGLLGAHGLYVAGQRLGECAGTGGLPL